MKTKLSTFFITLFIFAFYSTSLFAQEEEIISEKSLSVTVSPFHLLMEDFKIFEMTVEKNLNQEYLC